VPQLQQTIAPQDLDAEEMVLGALLLAGSTGGATASKNALGAVKAAGVETRAFYRHSHARIFRACERLVARSEPTDPILVRGELERTRELEDAGGKVRMNELAALCPAVGNVGHYARQVAEASERREQHRVGSALVQASENGGLAANAPLRASLQQLLTGGPVESGVVAVQASSVKRERVEWLDPGRIALGTAAIFFGEGGLGKGLTWAWWTAKATNGAYLDGPVRVAIATAEDALTFTVRPRLEAAGANLDLVDFLVLRGNDGLDSGIVIPDHCDQIEALVAEKQIRLIIIDPLVAHLGATINSWNDQSVRTAISPLHRMAERQRCAVVGVLHPNRAASSDPQRRVGGSGAFWNAARTSLMLARDPEDPDGETCTRRVLAHVKSNVGKLAPSLTLEIESVLLPAASDQPEVSTARMREVGESSVSGRDLLAATMGYGGEEPHSALAEAMDFLRQELFAAGWVAARSIQQHARELGISDSTLKRARRQMGIESKRQGGVGKDGWWSWRLPDADLDPLSTVEDQPGPY
jgi:hypothetical protein